VRVNGFYALPPLLTHLLELLVLALLLLVATGLGLRLLRLLRAHHILSLGERLLFSLALGLGALSLLMFAMGLMGLIDMPAGLLVLAALAGGAYAPLREIWPHFGPSARAALRALRYPPNLFLALIILLAAGTALIKALAPVATQDDLMYHLALPQRYIETHSLAFYPDSTYSGFPQAMEMLYTWGLLLGSDRLSVLLAFSSGMLGPASAALFAKRYRTLNHDGAWRTLPLLCAALFLSMPLTGFVLRAANTDLAQASFDFLALYAFVLFITRQSVPHVNRDKEQSHTLLLLAGIFAGLSFSTKYYGFAIAAFIGVALAVTWFARRKQPALPSLQAVLAAYLVPLAALSAPWLLRNAFATGNSVWPLAGDLFGGLYLSSTASPQSPEALLGSAPGFSPLNLWTSLEYMWQVMTRGPLTIDNQIHNVSLGFLLLPGLLALPFDRWSVPVRWFVAAGLWYWLLWAFFFSRTSARYLSTFYLLCALLGAYALVSLATRFHQPILRLLLGALIGGLLLLQAVQSATSLGYYLPAAFALDRSAEEQYLAAHTDDYPLISYIEENTPPEAVIYVWDGQPRGYRLPRTYVYARLVPLYTGFGSPPDRWRDRLRELGITHVLTHARDRLAPGQPPGEDPFQEAANQFSERYFGPPLLEAGDYTLYELK
jgi:hypothetical protein